MAAKDWDALVVNCMLLACLMCVVIILHLLKPPVRGIVWLFALVCTIAMAIGYAALMAGGWERP